jgi:hypothetical protein
MILAASVGGRACGVLAWWLTYFLVVASGAVRGSQGVESLATSTNGWCRVDLRFADRWLWHCDCDSGLGRDLLSLISNRMEEKLQLVGGRILT